MEKNDSSDLRNSGKSVDASSKSQSPATNEITTTTSTTTTTTQPSTSMSTSASTGFLRGRTDHAPTLGQIGRQTSVNFRLSHLSDSGAESCDADEQTQLIRSPSYRSPSHQKFIIIPAATATAKSSDPNAPAKPFRQTISTSSLATLAAAIQQQQQQQQKQQIHPPQSTQIDQQQKQQQLQRQFSAAVPASAASAMSAASKSAFVVSGSHPNVHSNETTTTSTNNDSITTQRHSHHEATTMTTIEGSPSASPSAVGVDVDGDTITTASGVKFTIDGCESDYDTDYNTGAHQPHRAKRGISSIKSATSLTPLTIGPHHHHHQSGLVSGLRPRNDRNSASMRSIVSAYLASSHDHEHEPVVQPKFHQSTHYLQPSATFSGPELSASSYLHRNYSANHLYSDVTSVRSLASIAVGSTDGRKLVIRRVPHDVDELFSLVHPPSPPPGGIVGDDDDSILDVSDETANLKPRQQYWGNKMQFVLACIGYSVGLGNVWRFPYMCYKSGGGVFLVPYCIILFICSIPLLFMELSIGQYTGRGPIGALGQLCPLFKGAGVASVVVSFLMSTYYSVIIGYSIYYFFTAFRPNIPWIDCNNSF